MSDVLDDIANGRPVNIPPDVLATVMVPGMTQEQACQAAVREIKRRELEKRNKGVLQEMTEAVKAMEATIPSENSSNQEKAQEAENALLRHLAREAVIADERDRCINQVEQLRQTIQQHTQSLNQARQEREVLVKALLDAGGELPKWEV